MAAKYYLDVTGLEALIRKIVSSDKAIGSRVNAITGQSGDSYTATTTNMTIIDDASSLQNAVEQLDTAIQGLGTSSHVAATAGNGIQGNGTNGALDATHQQISVKAKTNGGITVDANGVSLTTGASGINLKKLTTTTTGYASSYELQLNGTKVGDTINIPKDQFLKDVSYVTEAPSPAEGNSASVTFPALRFEWELDTDDDTSGEQTITYVSIASLGAVGAITTTRPNANSDSVINVTTAGLMNTDMVSTLVGWTNARITEDIDKLDNTDSATTGKVVDYVSTDNGIASPHKTYLTDVAITDYSKTNDSGALAATDTLEVALSKLENAIAGKQASGNYKTTQTAVADHTTATAADNDLVVVATTQNTNGVVTVTKNTVGAMLLTGYNAKSGATTGDVAATDSINAAIKKVEEKADSAISSAGVTSAAPASNSYITVSGTGSGSAKTGAVSIGTTQGTIPTPNSSTGVIGTVSSDGLVTASAVATAVNAVREALDGEALASTAPTAVSYSGTNSDEFQVLTRVNEVDGKVKAVDATANSTGSKSVTLKKVAATGAAADVSVADAGSYLREATNVEDAIQELANNYISTAYVEAYFNACVASATTNPTTSGNGAGHEVEWTTTGPNGMTANNSQQVRSDIAMLSQIEQGG